MRPLRWLLLAPAVLLALLAASAAALWAWAGTQASARWAVEQLQRRLPLQAEGVSGSLRRGVGLARVRWAQDGLSVEALDARFAWDPLQLLHRQLHVDRLEARVLRVDDQRPPDGTPPKAPESLVLPVAVRVDGFALGRVEWSGAGGLVLQDLAGRYAFDGQAHELVVHRLQVQEGRYEGEFRLGARGDLPLSARVKGRLAAPVPGAAQPLPLAFEAEAAGPLRAFDLRARLQGDPAGAATPVRATVQARVTPFEAMPLQQAQAVLQALDVGVLWAQAPRTELSGEVAVRPLSAQAWTFSADLRNAQPGPWDRRRLPAERMDVEGEWRAPTSVLVRRLDAAVGGGRLRAQGRWQGEDGWAVDGTLTGIDPSAVESSLASVPISGTASLRGDGPAIGFEAALQASGPPRARADAPLGALELRSLRARGRWAGQSLALPLLEVRTADARMDAALDLQPRARSGGGRIDLEAPGLRLRAVGSLAPRQGGGNARLAVASLGDAQRWLRRLPGLPPLPELPPLEGRGELQLAWQGGWDDPSVEATLAVPSLQPAAPAGQASAWAVRDLALRVDGRLADARVELKAQAVMGSRDATLALAGRAGQRAGGAWQGQLATLDAAVRDTQLGPAPWRVALRRPVDVRWAAGRLQASAGEATLQPPPLRGAALAPATLAWQPVQWDGRELRTAGSLSGLGLSWIELLGGAQLAGTAVSGDLVFDARWDAVVGDRLQVRAALERRSGDLSLLAETAGGAPARVQAGVRDARLAIEADGAAVVASLRWDSERAGSAQARLATQLAREGGSWAWPEAAPLSGQVRAQLPRLGVWSLLAPPGWRLRGSLATDIAVSGTRGAPDLRGTLSADDLALRSVVDGIALQDGRLRARLEGRQLAVQEFVLRGAGPAGGSVTGTGEGRWEREGLQVRATARLDRLRASARSDRELVLSGQVGARLDAQGAQVRGDLRVDRARILLPDEAAPRLSDDVVVRNLPPGAVLGNERRAEPARDAAAAPARPVDLAVNIDLGPDFRVQGRGIETRLAGTLAVTGDSLDEPRLAGTIRTVGGEYRAYGQRLDIERGVLRFTGPLDNPALDILAIRPRLSQRVGVQVTGTAQAPFVRLYAEPDLGEAEKLSWLVLGRPSASGGAEAALLQSAALALLQSRGGGTGGKGPAALLGLDELGFKREGAEGPAVTLGKRLGRNLYASYERSLAGTLGTLYVFYDLSRRLTVRAQAGERAAIDLIFTFAYD